MFRLRLKELRERDSLSQAALAKQLGVSQSTVGMWESGKNNPEYETLIKISKFFNVSVDFLTGDNKNKGVKIPVLGYVQAGLPIEAIENIVDYEEISQQLSERGEFFGLTVRGNSMEPRIYAGDVVIVRKQTDVESGDIAVVLVNGNDATVKKVIKSANGIMLVALNSAYEPLFYSNEDIEKLPVSIIGKVVELRGKL